MILLIVEDLPEEAEKLRRAALGTGFVSDVKIAPDMASARLIISGAERLGLLGLPYMGVFSVLLDHDLPEYDGMPDSASGVDIAKAILRLDPNTPIVGISAVASNNVHLENCGAFLSVEKPYAAKLMPSILRSCATWRKAMGTRRNPNLPIY